MLRFLVPAALVRVLWPDASNIQRASLPTIGKRTSMHFKSFAHALTRRPVTTLQYHATNPYLALNVLIHEEMIPDYDPRYFYHPHPGATLDGRYELKAKIGWGTSSTVWLAQDISRCVCPADTFIIVPT